MGYIFYIMGKSASGKDKIYSRMLEDTSLQLNHLILYTTRPIRANEENGKQYYFVDETELLRFRSEGKIIEERSYNTIAGVWTYFTVDVPDIDLEKKNYIGIGTLASYTKIRDYYGADKIVPIYIDVTDANRIQFAMHRELKQKNPDFREMCRRFLADCDDFSEDKIRDAGIEKRFYNNGELSDCLSEVREYIAKKECL